MKLALELPASLHRDLIAYGEVLGREAGQEAVEPARLIVGLQRRVGSSPVRDWISPTVYSHLERGASALRRR